MSTLTPKAAGFLHVINDHRWLAVAGCAWNLAGPNGQQKDEASRLLPNIDVMILDSLLLHARSLIKFYTNDGNGTDILLSDFSQTQIAPALRTRLEERYEHAIEVHLLHLTDWRDTGYRSANVTGRGAYIGRPDWNLEAHEVVVSRTDFFRH